MGQRIHRTLAEASVQTLEAVLCGGAVADRAVARALGAHPKWGARDRAFVAETVYEVVRWQRRLAFLAGSGEPAVLAGLHWQMRGFERPEWAAWLVVSAENLAARQAQLEHEPRAVRESVSDDLDALGLAGLGAVWEVELRALNAPAPVFLRINPLRTSVEKVIAELAAEGLTAVPVAGAPLALRLERPLPPRLRQTGRYEIQDAASQQVAVFCQVKPGDLIVDACAGHGGKSLHLAALQAGELWALDIHDARLKVLRERAARAGVKRLRTAVIEARILESLRGRADCVLVDAPCSGSGTLRRQADLKYRITAESVAEKAALQRELLARFAPLVKPGGALVYATCSIFPEENEAQAAWFSAANAEFRLEEERRISPAATGWDGFYMARWRRG